MGLEEAASCSPSWNATAGEEKDTAAHYHHHHHHTHHHHHDHHDHLPQMLQGEHEDEEEDEDEVDDDEEEEDEAEVAYGNRILEAALKLQENAFHQRTIHASAI